MKQHEIDRALALAIGYMPKHVHGKDSIIVDRPTEYRNHFWQDFSHTDPAVIWPLAKHYKCFPEYSNFWKKWFAVIAAGEIWQADTPEAAVAMAIIKGSKL